MNSPIVDFVKRYSSLNNVRFHMPGHKGESLLGLENYDITEIDGADELFAPSGIIAESLKNASQVFGCPTFYSAEGSTLCIQAMVYLVALYSRINGKEPFILAARNAHKSFINACALTSVDIKWIYPSEKSAYYSCVITPEELENAIKECDVKPDAVYVTSPDYLGNITDIRALSVICKKYGILLLADNAHGAYLKFLPESRHPIDLGADMCCDSAHKTLPVLTGGAYIHLSDKLDRFFTDNCIKAMSLFASSSPSYLILESLDNFNVISASFKDRLGSFIPKVKRMKDKLIAYGYDIQASEDLKITIGTKAIGYTGDEFARVCKKNGIIPEFYDNDNIVFMLSPYNEAVALEYAERFFTNVKIRGRIDDYPPDIPRAKVKFKPSDVIYFQSEKLFVDDCVGRICAYSVISCPPAVPVIVSGEEISREAVDCLKYYNINTCDVIKE